jgi:hypothetical protein
MLEGSMRMGGNRAGITAELIETEAVFGPTASTAHWRTYSIWSRQTSSAALQTPDQLGSAHASRSRI